MNCSTSATLTSLVGGIVILLAGCSGDESPKVNPGAANAPKPAESIIRLDSPFDRSLAYTAQLNTRRLETFRTEMPVIHSNVAYTAAYRHAVYLNTLNSAEYQPNGANPNGDPVQASTDTITGGTAYATLRAETPPAGNRIFPALFTNSAAYARVAAVVGSPDLLAGCSPSDINEFFVFNGNIPTSSRGRTALMRASLKAWAYGSAYDGNCVCPPWPILDQRFMGTVTTVTYAQKVAMLGYWPNPNNNDVCPYGLDTDIASVGGAANVRYDYSGPPIHITIPVAEPFVMNADTFAGGVTVSFRKLGGSDDDGVTQAQPNAGIVRNMVLRLRQSGRFRFILRGGQTVNNVTTPGPYDYSFLPSAPAFDAGDQLRDGELIMVPTEPLEPDSWYEVGVRLRTASYVLPVDSTDETQLFTWRFKTNRKTPY